MSFQAVSKWETGTTLPDVTLVPSIAAFFGISTDELFSYNVFLVEKNIEEIVANYSVCAENDWQRGEEILRDGLKKYPGNETLLACLAECLPMCERCDEVLQIGKALADASKSDENKYNACRLVAEAYCYKGEVEAAKQYIEKIPELYFTKLSVAAKLLEGEEKLMYAAKQKVLAFEWLILSYRELARHYEECGETEQAQIHLQIIQNLLDAVKCDLATAYTKPLYQTYKDFLVKH